MTILLTSGILFSTEVNTELVAKPAMLDIALSISVIFLSASLIFFSNFDSAASYVVFETNPVVSMLSTF